MKRLLYYSYVILLLSAGISAAEIGYGSSAALQGVDSTGYNTGGETDEENCTELDKVLPASVLTITHPLLLSLTSEQSVSRGYRNLYLIRFARAPPAYTLSV